MKKYNVLIISIILILLGIISSLNIIIDPFNVFHTKNYFNRKRPNIAKNQRISTIPSFKFDKREINSLWLGSSKTGWETNLEYESELLNGNMFDLTLNHCSIQESIIMAKNAILIHPEIKTIYWGLDFSEFKKTEIENINTIQIAKTKNITKEEILPLVLSFDTFVDTIKTIQTNLKKNIKIPSYKDYGKEKRYNKKIENKYKNTINNYHRDFYSNYKFDTEKFNKIKDFIEYANSKGIQVVIFATTMHITERILIDNTNNSEAFNTFKKELAKIQPYYDFAIVNKYTTEKIRPDMQYFRDAIHSYSFLRKKITNQLFLNNEDFGILINNKNVDNHIKSEDDKFIKFMQTNEELKQQVKEWSK